MLNNDELWEKSQMLAELLNAASTDEGKVLSTKRKNMVENVLKTINKKQFVDAVTDIVPIVSQREKLIEIVRDIHNMPSDNVPYFLTLLRFQYESLK